MSQSTRAGRYVRQPTGYRAFIPAPLPPDPPVDLGGAGRTLLSRADLAIGRLDGVGLMLPSADLFLAMYVRREAVASSQIEGTRSTLDDVLVFELDPRTRDVPADVEEVVHYIRAMNYGLDRLATLPLSLRLIREIHAELMRGGHGVGKTPGEFRTSQNWMGPANTPLNRATFVPPPASELLPALDNFERFLHQGANLPALILCGLAHAQFETIHPFLDGNGRVGRLLIALLLVHRGVLHRPLLYVSHFLRIHRAEYYERLTAVHDEGNWEGWLRFFLRGVAETAEKATATARAIVALRERHRQLLLDHGFGHNELRFLDMLLHRPLVNVKRVQDELDVVDMTASRLIDRLAGLDLLEEITGRRRNRIFRYTLYWQLFQDPAPPEDEVAPIQSTEFGAEL